MPMPTHLAGFWGSFAKSNALASEERFYEAFSFGDSKELADELADLVLRGTKRATASALWTFEIEGKRLPKTGDLSIVTNWSGTPLCVIETQRIDVVPFMDVTAEFAATEGEGDGSLSFWREVHRAFFTRECERLGREFSDRMSVVCERFAVIYRGEESAA
jgi:uncharacterized protein YhfF